MKNKINDSEITYYEVIRLRQNALLFFEAHIARLLKSIALGGHQNTVDAATIRQNIMQFIAQNGVKAANIRVTVTIGYEQPIKVVYVEGVYPSSETYQTGVAVETVEFVRQAPNVKQQSNALLNLRNDLARRGIHDFLLIDQDGYITEGSKTNVFFVKGNAVYTAPLKRVLGGITRAEVVKCVPDHCQFNEIALHKSELKQCDAAFLTGTSIDILPICSIDGKRYTSADNAIVKDMIQHFAKKVNSDIAEHQLNV